MTDARRLIAPACLLASLAACGGSSPSSPAPPPAAAATITITGAGVDQKSVAIALGGRVQVVNNDATSHSIGSNPHPDHTDCPNINQVGFLAPGQRRETGNFSTARTCGFHDHEDPTNQKFWGTITTR